MVRKPLRVRLSLQGDRLPRDVGDATRQSPIVVQQSGRLIVSDEGLSRPSFDSLRVDLTELLHRSRNGDPDAAERLLPLIHGDLRRIARRVHRNEQRMLEVEPTELVSEAYLRLFHGNEVAPWQNRSHFFSMASWILRRIVVDHVRKRDAPSRKPPGSRVPLEDSEATYDDPSEDLLAFEERLARLEEQDPAAARVVALRVFADMSIPEIAEGLHLDRNEVRRHWRFARAWLLKELKR